MANDKKVIENKQNIKVIAAKQKKEDKHNDFLLGLSAFLVATSIMAILVIIAFYIVIHNNYNGLGEKYRNSIQNIPILNLALPDIPSNASLADMTFNQLKDKCIEYERKSQELSQSLDSANKTISDLQKYKDLVDKAQSDSDNAIKNLQYQQEQVDEAKKKLDDLQNNIDSLIAKGDQAGFKAYFEQIDNQTAKSLYEQVLKAQQLSSDTQKFISMYNAMDAKPAAKILEQLGDSKLNLVVDILKNMNKDKSAEILAKMSPSYASKVTDKLSKLVNLSSF